LIIEEAVEVLICAPSGPDNSPFRELLREQGALLTLRPIASFTDNLPLLQEPILLALPADRLLEKGHRFILSSALLPTLNRVFSFLFSLSPAAFIKISFHLLEAGPGEGEEEGKEDGSMKEFGASELSEVGLLSETEMLRFWRGKRMPSEKSSSAEGRFEWRLDGLFVPTTPQNSNSGDDEKLLWLCLGELGVLAIGETKRERESEGKRRFIFSLDI
jgi:hypothetical protein